MKREYIVVEDSDQSNFNRRANELAAQGYKIISSKILAVEQPQQDYFGFRYAAIFEYEAPE